MYKYISTLSAFLLMTVAFAANDIKSAPGTDTQVASLLHDYDFIQGEIDGLNLRTKKIQADIDTMSTDLHKFDQRMANISDSMIQLRRTCGEYLVLARKYRKTSPEISFMQSRKRVYRSIRRNGYINADIFKATRELSNLTERYLKIFNEKERIRYLCDHQSDLYAMLDNIEDRKEILESRADNIMDQINPRRNEAEAIIEARNAYSANLDHELASTYIVRIKRDRKPDEGKSGREDGQANTPGSSSLPSSLSAFESKMGAMMFPVSGKYNIIGRYGVYAHPEFEHITVNNPGIDIESVNGSKARVVFPGKVEAIFEIPGYNKVVLVSHDNYYTVYGNLSDTDVVENMEVKDGQVLGSIVQDNGHYVLHFEVRLGTIPLDPTLWVKL